MSLTRSAGLLALALLFSARAIAASIGPERAGEHVGETATVCGVVASANFAARSKGQPTFLNLEKAYPNHIFTAVIWGSDRSKFGAPETQLVGKRVCTTGVIELYRGKPEVILHNLGQLSEP